jgi:hypothetical protein
MLWGASGEALTCENFANKANKNQGRKTWDLMAENQGSDMLLGHRIVMEIIS